MTKVLIAGDSTPCMVAKIYYDWDTVNMISLIKQDHFSVSYDGRIALYSAMLELLTIDNTVHYAPYKHGKLYFMNGLYGGLLFTNEHKNYIHLYHETMISSDVIFETDKKDIKRNNYDECFELISNELSRLIMKPYKTRHKKSIIEYGK